MQKDDTVLEVTEKAYRVVYAAMGYVPVTETKGGASRGKTKKRNTKGHAVETEQKDQRAQEKEVGGESDE